MEQPVLNATFIVTYNPETRISAFDPSSQDVLTGGTVTLVAAAETTVQARLSPSGTDYKPFGGTSNEYVALPRPGNVYTLASTMLDTGHLIVKGVWTNPAATIVPVVKMSFSSSAFSPDPIGVSQGGKVQLVVTEGTTAVSVKTYKPDGTAFPLFGIGGGPDRNTYTVQPSGTSYTVPTTVEAPHSYIIEYAPAPGPPTPVRGTVNVTVRK